MTLGHGLTQVASIVSVLHNNLYQRLQKQCTVNNEENRQRPIIENR